jgi:hypothetical protein
MPSWYKPERRRRMMRMRRIRKRRRRRRSEMYVCTRKKQKCNMTNGGIN